jgi:uncharacterized membrane protein
MSLAAGTSERRSLAAIFWGRGGSFPIGRLLLLLIVLLAFGLRVFDLDGQSMWNDEGLSVYRARQPLATIAANIITIDGSETRDTNPPLYFLLLHLWRGLGGESVFALRFLAVLIAVLNVPLLYELGRLTFNRSVGLAAAFFLAISPFHVWQSQEMRNYSLLLFFNLLSIVGLFHFVLAHGRHRRWRWLLLWAIAGLAGIYTHYLGAFVFAYGVMVIVWQSLFGKSSVVSGRLIEVSESSELSRPARRLSPRVIAILAALALIAIPILWMGLSRYQEGPQIDFVFVPVHHLLSHAASAFSVGIVHGFVQPLWRVAPAVILAIAGVIAAWLSGKRLVLILVLGYLFIPFLLLVALSTLNPIYNGPRHLIMGLPPFLLLVAAGLVLPWAKAAPGAVAAPLPERSKTARGRRLWRSLTAVLGLILVMSQFAWLNTQFTSADLVKDDLRGLAQYLEGVAQENDLIVLHDSIIGLTFDYYYERAAPWIAIPALGNYDVESAAGRLQEAGRGVNRVWFVTEPTPRTGFPRRELIEWARENWPRLGERRFPSLWLSLNEELYVPEPTVSSIPAAAAETTANWGDELSLLGFEGSSEATSGSFWQPVFYWSKQGQVDDQYSLSIRLADDQGHLWAQLDQSLWQQNPPASWADGAIVRHAPPLSLPAGIPPGDYQVWLRITRQSDGRPLLAGDQVELLLMPSLSVAAATAPAGAAQLPAHSPVGASFAGEIELVGYELLDADYRPGHALTVDLFWQARRSASADYIQLVQLLDGQGQVVSEETTSPSLPSYPPTAWGKDELLHGQARLVVPASAEAGTYMVRLSLIHPDTGESLPAGWALGPRSIALAELAVTPWPLITELPAVPRPRQADFGQPAVIRLLGYDVSPWETGPGDKLELTLFWQSLTGEMTGSYSVFVHLLDENGEIVAQADGLPLSGFRPTTSWRKDEALVDGHSLSIPAEAAGPYRLWIGFYDPESGLRLPVSVEGTLQADGRLPLTEIIVR